LLALNPAIGPAKASASLFFIGPDTKSPDGIANIALQAGGSGPTIETCPNICCACF
jgi:hypothetical protein